LSAALRAISLRRAAAPSIFRISLPFISAAAAAFRRCFAFRFSSLIH
jgi:hypothetical protein